MLQPSIVTASTINTWLLWSIWVVGYLAVLAISCYLSNECFGPPPSGFKGKHRNLLALLLNVLLSPFALPITLPLWIVKVLQK